MILSSRCCGAVALLALWAPAVQGQPAQAPSAVQRPAAAVSLAFFEQRLSAFGHWISHPVWGAVWQPDAGRDFRPYFYGYWQYTSDYGWLWVSNEPYGDIVYHYGRWVYDPNFGWLWVPGYVWGPSWVAWRETDDYIGWLPMPPGYQDFSLPTVGPSYGPDELYGYQNFYGSNFASDAFAGLWIFVPALDFGRSDRRHYVFDSNRVRDLYRHSQDRTHYLHDRDRDRIVDRSIDKDALERSTHRHFDAPPGRQFLRGDTPRASVTEGQEIARRNRDRSRAGIPESANPLKQSVPADVAGRRGSAVRPLEAPQFGSGLRVLGQHDAPQATRDRNGAASDAGVPHSAAPLVPNPQRRGLVRSPLSGVPSPSDAPPTDISRGMRNRPVPPAVPQIEVQPGISAPGHSPREASPRSFGVNIAPANPAPNVVLRAPPPLSPPAVGLPSGPAVPSVRATPPVSAPPMPAAAVPQTGPRGGPRSGAGNGSS